MQTKLASRDLGLDATAGRSRSLVIHNTRWNKARARAAITARFSEVDRACCKLIPTGTWAQGTWGHEGYGLPPAKVDEARNFMIDSLVTRKGNMNGIMLYALHCGIEHDPYITLRTQQLWTFIELWRLASGQWKRNIAEAWPIAARALKDT